MMLPICTPIPWKWPYMHSYIFYILFFSVQFLDAIGKRQSNMDQLSVLASTGTENAQKIRKLSIVQQIDHGLF